MTATDIETIDNLASAEHRAEAAAEKAAEKARAARAAREAAEAEEGERRAAGAREFWQARQTNYRRDFGGRIDGAWSEFVDAVRAGGNTVEAWSHYRTTRVTVADEFAALDQRRRQRENDAAQKILDRWRDLNREGMRLDTVPRDERGPQWAEALANWHREAAMLEGREPHRLTNLPHALAHPDGVKIQPSPINAVGPDPDKDSSYAEAIDRAMRLVEADALTEAKANRRAELTAHLSAGASA